MNNKSAIDLFFADKLIGKRLILSIPAQGMERDQSVQNYNSIYKGVEKC
jgi:hypothetical protein